MIRLDKLDRPLLMEVALRATGWNWRTKKGDQIKGGCPFHGSGPKSASMSINTRIGKFFCHKCKFTGDAIDWYRRSRNMDFLPALRELHRMAGIPIPESED